MTYQTTSDHSSSYPLVLIERGLSSNNIMELKKRTEITKELNMNFKGWFEIKFLIGRMTLKDSLLNIRLIL